MKISFFTLALVLSLSACGASDNSISDADASKVPEKSKAQTAQETYDSMQGSLSVAQKCEKLNELAELYYAEADTRNYELAKVLADVACASERSRKSMGG